MTSIRTHDGTTETAELGARRVWRIGLLAGGIALAANLALLAIAGLAGADLSVQRASQDAITIGVGMVASMTAIPVLMGTALLVALRKRGAKAWRNLALLGLIVGVLTAPVPFTVEADGGTHAALASMHLITGLVWFAVLNRATRSLKA